MESFPSFSRSIGITITIEIKHAITNSVCKEPADSFNAVPLEANFD